MKFRRERESTDHQHYSINSLPFVRPKSPSFAMRSLSFTVLSSLSLLARAAPTTSEVTPVVQEISKRDPCDGVNAEPVLYKEYREADCPAKYKYDSNGHCSGYHNIFNACQQFCQVRKYTLRKPSTHYVSLSLTHITGTNFVYAQEVPFANTYCHGPLTCTVTSTHTETVTINVGVNAKFLEAYGLGVSGGLSKATANAVARAFQVKLENGECGYFTFVPIRKDVW